MKRLFPVWRRTTRRKRNANGRTFLLRRTRICRRCQTYYVRVWMVRQYLLVYNKSLMVMRSGVLWYQVRPVAFIRHALIPAPARHACLPNTVYRTCIPLTDSTHACVELVSLPCILLISRCFMFSLGLVPQRFLATDGLSLPSQHRIGITNLVSRPTAKVWALCLLQTPHRLIDLGLRTIY
jgi:hypothetical protein